jgi:hypothetical protein
VADSFFEADATQGVFVDILQDIAVCDDADSGCGSGTSPLDPQVVGGTYRTSDLKEMLEAYVQLRDDPTVWTGGRVKPPSFDNLMFIVNATITGDYNDVSVQALNAMRNQVITVLPEAPANAENYLAWKDHYCTFNPECEINVRHKVAGYDVLMTLALAMTAAGSTDGAVMAEEFSRVTSPPGTVILPGEYAKARDLLLRGEDIDYQGAAFTDLKYDETGNGIGVVYYTAVLNSAATGFDLETEVLCLRDDVVPCWGEAE